MAREIWKHSRTFVIALVLHDTTVVEMSTTLGLDQQINKIIVNIILCTVNLKNNS